MQNKRKIFQKTVYLIVVDRDRNTTDPLVFKGLKEKISIQKK